MTQSFDPRNRSQLGLLGLGVMGANLCRNLLDHGYRVDGFDYDPGKGEAIAAEGRAGFRHRIELDTLVAGLEPPRCLLLMVPAGAAVDEAMANLTARLSPGDIIVDLGNSHYRDSERRLAAAAAHELRFVGCGISGGAAGARHGPALMPGGDAAAWPLLRDVLETIAARFDDEPCVSWIGPGGAGHFVKTVHNGIEYADMQLIAETWHLAGAALGLEHDAIGRLFETWNRGPLESYLVQITAIILQTREADGGHLVDRIVDRAGQKGTGAWSSLASFDYAVPATLLAESVYARMLSARKDQRLRVAAQYPARQLNTTASTTAEALEQALYAAKILAYAQGFELLQQASREHGWGLKPAAIAAGWRAGCVIRGALLRPAMDALTVDPDRHLVEAGVFRDALAAADGALREVVGLGVARGIPLPAFGAALTYLDAIRSETLPASLIQAQRDFFGSHGFERTDGEPGELHHFDWPGEAD